MATPGTRDRLSPDYQRSPARPNSKMVGYLTVHRARPRWASRPHLLTGMLEESGLVSSRIGLGDPPVAQLTTFDKSPDITNSSTRLVGATVFEMWSG